MSDKMKTFWIRVGLAGSFGGCENNDWQEVECIDRDQAYKDAWHMAVEKYQEYEGYGGLDSIDSFMEEADGDEEDAQMLYMENVESWIDYEVSSTKPEDLE